MDKIYNKKPVISTLPKQKYFVKIPYIGENSFYEQLQKLLGKFYPHVDFLICHQSEKSIGSFFHYKDVLPSKLRSNIVYLYTCDACQATYVGSSVKQSIVRYHQHLGTSHRTSLPLKNPVDSSIRKHCHDSDHQIKISNFSIIAQSNSSDIRILESLLIRKLKPSLNIDSSAHPLYIT